MLAPALLRIHDEEHVTGPIIQALEAETKGKLELGPVAHELADRLLSFDLRTESLVALVRGRPDLFPLRRVLPRLHWKVVQKLVTRDAVPRATADAVLGDAALPWTATMAELVPVASPAVATAAVRRALADSTLPDDELPGVVASALSHLGGAGADLVESALLRELESSPLDPQRAKELSGRLIGVRPASPLLPRTAKALLSQPDHDSRCAGISLFEGLAQPDLMPHVSPLLESPDERLRSRARDALEKVLEIKRLRDATR